MKSYPLVLLLIFSLYACNSASNKKDTAPKSIEESSLKADSKNQKPNHSRVTTSTGKTIEVIEESNQQSETNLTMIPVGFPNSKDSISLKNIDPVKEILVEDLDANGFDEIYVITQNAGSGSYGNVYAYASNNDLSMTTIYFPDITEQDLEKDGAFQGYMGHDSIYISNKMLYRKFPVYKPDDPNCCPTGGSNTIGYKLKAGEASWLLQRVEKN